jgi:hypothetical protein
MTLRELSRRRLFLASAWVLTLNLLFYAAWQRIAPRLTPCNGKAIGVEVGLVSALIALVLAMFGLGAKRWLLGVAALVVSYFWFSWITWIGQMQC